MDKLLEMLGQALSASLARVRYRSRIEVAAEVLKHEVLQGVARKLVEEELCFMLVRQGTNLAANEAKRERVFELIEKSKSELSDGAFARLRHRLQIPYGELVAVVESSDARNRRVALGLCAPLFMVGTALMAVPALLQVAGLNPGPGLVAGTLIQGIAIDGLPIFLIAQVEHMKAAAELAPVLERLQGSDA